MNESAATRLLAAELLERLRRVRELLAVTCTPAAEEADRFLAQLEEATRAPGGDA